MKEHEKRCMLGFSEEKIIEKRKSKKELERIATLTKIKKTKDGIVCTYKPPLSKSDKEDLGYHYIGDILYNLNHAPVPNCVFCPHYR